MLIGIDLGTSFIKGALLDPDGLRVSHIQRVPFPAPLPGLAPGRWEFDPLAIMRAVRGLLDTLLAGAGECDGLLICGQMHGLVFTTQQGEPRSNFTSWQDQRLLEPHPSGQGSYFDFMKGQLSADEVKQLGNDLRPGLPLGQCFWLAQQGAFEPGLSPASLPDFVLANLCHAAPNSEPTNAMAHGALNLESMDWHWPVLERLGLGRLNWPAIRRSGEVAGWWISGSQRIACYTPVGDAQCALAGALLQSGELSLNIATGSQISLLRPRVTFGNFATRPYFDGRCLVTVADIPAGRALSLLVKLLSELAGAQQVELADPWPYIVKAAAEAGQTDLRAEISFFHSDCGEEGQLTRLREETLTVGHLFRAAFQNMADNYHSCALRLSPEQEWTGLVFSGGLAQKIDILRQLICEKFKVDYRLSPMSEDTLLGLLTLALAFTGRAQSVEQATALLLEKFAA